MIVGIITFGFGVIFFVLSLVYMYYFVSPAHFVMSGENPVSLQAGFIICILVSALLIYGVRQNNRFCFIPFLVWCGIEAIFTASTIFLTVFSVALLKAAMMSVILIVLIAVDLSLVYFAVIVISYYLQLRDQFLNDPENEPKPFDKIPA
jgi:CDP-diglyceride synthetase